jgi:predicted Co/Zn/Cd cation transporter (cation efflux family)
MIWDVDPEPVMAHNRPLAGALAITLVALAVVAYSLAAVLDFTLSGGQSLDPHRSGLATAGGAAAALCISALWRLRRVARGRTGWLDAGVWFALAVVALVVLVAVAFGSRLGG